VVSVWLGLVLSYFVPDSPPSFSILAVATAMYGLALGRRAIWPRLSRSIDTHLAANAARAHQ
jgi:hypothetical protein